MHCFATENQTYAGTVIFVVESLKSRKRTAEKSTTEKPPRKRPIFVMENIFKKSTVFKAPTEWFLKGLYLTLREISISRHQI